MNTRSDFYPYIAVFAIATLVVGYFTLTRRSAGLGLAYAFQMWLLFGSGACLHALPWSELSESATIYDGFRISTYGMAAFAAGWAAAPFVAARPEVKPVHQNTGLVRLYLLAGVFSYVVLQPLLGNLPTLNALTAVGQNLCVVGLCLGAYVGWQQKKWPGVLRWCLPAVLLPVVTMANSGFLGFGIAALAVVGIFCATFVKPRWVLAVGTCIGIYAGLSVYTTYMRDRDQIRAVVWGGEGASARLNRLAQTFSNFEFFDVHNQSHLELFDARMDQNLLVGMSVQNLTHSGDFANGETLIDALIALVPRAVWPDKPVMAGSGNLVTRFTGTEFAEGTSVGIGAVMEWYVNFGVPGVVIGFALMGILIEFFDARAAAALASGNWQKFVLWFLVGMAFLQVGGSFVEVTSSAGAGAAVAYMVNSLFNAQARRAEQKKLSKLPDRWQPA